MRPCWAYWASKKCTKNKPELNLKFPLKLNAACEWQFFNSLILVVMAQCSSQWGHLQRRASQKIFPLIVSGDWFGCSTDDLIMICRWWRELQLWKGGCSRYFTLSWCQSIHDLLAVASVASSWAAAAIYHRRFSFLTGHWPAQEVRHPAGGRWVQPLHPALPGPQPGSGSGTRQELLPRWWGGRPPLPNMHRHCAHQLNLRHRYSPTTEAASSASILKSGEKTRGHWFAL